MDSYILVLVSAGLLILLVAWLPMLLREMPLSLPIVCVAIGWLVFTYVLPADSPHPLRYPELTERMTEMLVIVALMGCGLKLDRPFAWKSWRATWRLLGIVMPLCIAGVVLLGWGFMGLSLGAAILLGAALAPTDPVLASDVQVGPPLSGEEDEVRFSLTSEAGLNDGLAFPFTNLALAVALHTGVAMPADRTIEGTGDTWGWIWHWIALDVAWKLAAGLAVGWLVGRALGYLTFRLPNRAKLSRTGDGFLALAMTFISYGVTELVHGYGFLAVFMTALAFREAERGHSYHERLHDFAEQIERLFMMVVLLLFGGAIAHGLMAPLTWEAAAVGLVFLFFVRPAATLLAFRGLGWHRAETLVVGFFGIRGVGSIYYLAYALNEANWAAEATTLWAVASFIMLTSIILHGTTVTPIMRLLDQRNRDRDERRVTGPPAQAPSPPGVRSISGS
ncbi:cation:proton antiporter [Arenibaculum pallidiluteum]|uniref:cation:proton antiporter n=1 Tax=Arenibaculum pallidiluteum TaxID=2812559 RepID=UPI001A9781FB|nr:cation:proton antiporter [Arenibaculum pallidiluteum]